MKKTGIVTLFDHNNYGALLQAYALMVTLRKMNTDVKFISLSDGPQSAPANMDRLPAIIRKIQEKGYSRNLLFDEFRNRWLPSERFSEMSDSEYDLFIVGSDQVWNPEITGNDDRFYLSFTDAAKRAAYAVSFGRQTFDEALSRQLKGRVESFGGPVAVREKTGAAFIREMCGKSVPVCLDPTLLTTEDDWTPVIEDECSMENEAPYLLLIMVQSDPGLYEQARKIAGEKGLKLKLITPSYFPAAGFEPWSGISVPKYLKLIKNADYVLSSSFHGIAFSIIFRKELGLSYLTGELSGRNTRMLELLESLGLSDRIGYCDTAVKWDAVSMKLAQMQQGSIDYLQGVVK